jgi:hypothetical protein
MFQQKMILSGLERQSRLLSGLIAAAEGKSGLDAAELRALEQIAGNLRRLRKIKQAYFRHTDFGDREFTATLHGVQEESTDRN